MSRALVGLMSRDQLVDWGTGIGANLGPEVVLALHGELGAGKTTLAQALCAGMGVRDDVTSPTFTLVHRYASPRGPVHHLDLYRLTAEQDLDNLGFDELIDGARAVIIEWPERAAARLPKRVMHVWLSHVPDAPELRRVEAA